jgi:hypothetical protein
MMFYNFFLETFQKKFENIIYYMSKKMLNP